MNYFAIGTSLLVIAVSIFLSSYTEPLLTAIASSPLPALFGSSRASGTNTITSPSAALSPPQSHMSSTETTAPVTTTSMASKTAGTAASKMAIPYSAKLTARRSGSRGHADHGWLNTYHTFSFSSYYDSKHTSFGALRVLNEDRVAPHSGFPTHPHRDAEIFSYILSGELTHRDSMIKPGATSDDADKFFRMRPGDVQFTTGGSGIAHSEHNESNEWVHFLQIWATPWARGLTPRYHTKTFSEAAKREGFVPILSPLKAGPGASKAEETAAVPALEGTIPIHADLVMGAGILAKGKVFGWRVGGPLSSSSSPTESNGDGEKKSRGEEITRKHRGRKAYLHLAMKAAGAKGTGKKAESRIRVAGREELAEGDGLYVEGIDAGQVIEVENLGDGDAEVVILDVD